MLQPLRYPDGELPVRFQSVDLTGILRPPYSLAWDLRQVDFRRRAVNGPLQGADKSQDSEYAQKSRMESHAHGQDVEHAHILGSRENIASHPAFYQMPSSKQHLAVYDDAIRCCCGTSLQLSLIANASQWCSFFPYNILWIASYIILVHST